MVLARLFSLSTVVSELIQHVLQHKANVDVLVTLAALLSDIAVVIQDSVSKEVI
jgi:hypothetical protein